MWYIAIDNNLGLDLVIGSVFGKDQIPLLKLNYVLFLCF